MALRESQLHFEGAVFESEDDGSGTQFLAVLMIKVGPFEDETLATGVMKAIESRTSAIAEAITGGIGAVPLKKEMN